MGDECLLRVIEEISPPRSVRELCCVTVVWQLHKVLKSTKSSSYSVTWVYMKNLLVG